MASYQIAISFNNRVSVSQAMHQSGITQNAKFLYDLLLRIGQKPYFLVSVPAPGRRVEICGLAYRAYTIVEAIELEEPTRLALEVAVTLSPGARHCFRERFGAKIVCVRYGHSMYMDMEEICHGEGRLEGALHVNCPDEVWASPHFELAYSYLETLYQAPVRTCPFIWEPDFVRKRASLPYKAKPNVYVMEPNLSVLKNALIPMTIIERQYREAPDSFGAAYILNGLKFKDRSFFLENIVRNFSCLIGDAKKAYFCERARFNEVFQQRDILLGHQMGCELSYLYMEALYRNVPLVHNSPAYREVGFYYADCDAREGRSQLAAAIESTDLEQQAKANLIFLDRFSIHNQTVQQTYLAMFESLLV